MLHGPLLFLRDSYSQDNSPLNKKFVTGIKIKDTGESKLNGSPGDDDYPLILQWKNYIHSLYYPAPGQTRGALVDGVIMLYYYLFLPVEARWLHG